MNETSKAMRRRFSEDARTGTTTWADRFAGQGIDIGCGNDPVRVTPTPIMIDNQPAAHISLVCDATKLAKHYPPGTFDWLHASQCLEHVPAPVETLCDQWLPLLKPAGRAIITVPSWELYERMVWPSRWNPDHKSTWSLWQRGSPAPVHIYVPDLIDYLRRLGWRGTTAALVDTNYNYARTDDQTFDESASVEAFIEIIVQR